MSQVQSSSPAMLRDQLRQMLAVLEEERQALAGLDIDALMGAANDKNRLCGSLEDAAGVVLDEECRGMLEAAKRLNEVNRQVRNLVAANVTARLNAMTGSPQLYHAGPRYAYAGAR
ncbi:flagellar protein FlgN [Novosphingobium fluoreni]|uniref:flagellar protein FlgN n=1 Tax=Novosphingobium fluoreni TaxID=1391222 RepID=UPI003DA0F692